VTVGKQHGRIQVFIVEALLAFFNIKVDYANDLMTVGDSDWFPAHRGARREFLLQLTCSTTDGTDFDLMTDDLIKQTTADIETLDQDTVDLQQYIEQSNQQTTAISTWTRMKIPQCTSQLPTNSSKQYPCATTWSNIDSREQ